MTYPIVYSLAIICFAVAALALARALWSLNRARLIRKRKARIAALLEHRHVWREARHRVVDNTTT